MPHGLSRFYKVIIRIVLLQAQKLVVFLPYAGAVQIEAVLVVGAIDADRCGCESEHWSNLIQIIIIQVEAQDH